MRLVDADKLIAELIRYARQNVSSKDKEVLKAIENCIEKIEKQTAKCETCGEYAHGWDDCCTKVIEIAKRSG